jgi:ATP-binding cassette subfamily B protein
VPQEAFLFSCSIHENIAFSNPELPRERVIEVAKIAAIDEDITEFPAGYDTIVGEKGVTLSGGQKQRVAIARALIKNPEILILDDCLSAVDTKTEEKILGHLKEVMKDRTSIIISHRISAIKDADEILYLEDGVITERGTHSELLVQKGAYEDLYRKQLLEEKLDKEV